VLRPGLPGTDGEGDQGRQQREQGSSHRPHASRGGGRRQGKSPNYNVTFDASGRIGHNLAQCIKPIQDAIISHCTRADADYGRRVTESMHKHIAMMKSMEKPQPMATAPEMATQGK